MWGHWKAWKGMRSLSSALCTISLWACIRSKRGMNCKLVLRNCLRFLPQIQHLRRNFAKILNLYYDFAQIQGGKDYTIQPVPWCHIFLRGCFLVECDCELVALNNIFMITIELYTSWQLHSIIILEVIWDANWLSTWFGGRIWQALSFTSSLKEKVQFCRKRQGCKCGIAKAHWYEKHNLSKKR